MLIEDALQVACIAKDFAMHDACAMYDTCVKLCQLAACGMVCDHNVVRMAMQQMSG